MTRSPRSPARLWLPEPWPHERWPHQGRPHEPRARPRKSHGPWAGVLVASTVVACSHDWDAWLPSGSGAAGGGGTSTGGTTSSGVGGGGGIPEVPGLCPESTENQTPLMKVATPQAEAVCIEATELTRGHYEYWLDNGPMPTAPDMPPECDYAWPDFEPAFDWPPNGLLLDHPVVFVDWCDAWAYCNSQGRHLCGSVGGGSVALGDWTKANVSEWYAACTAAGTRVFPYGNTFQAGTCYDEGSDTVPVGSLPGCVDVTEQVFDLSGNVSEWEDSCSAQAGATDSCRLRGGGSNNSDCAGAGAALCETALRCAIDDTRARGEPHLLIGFRCCADVLPE